MAYKCVAFAMLLLAAMNLPGISADCDASQLPPIEEKCEKFILKGGPKLQPSQECCSVLKNIDVSCICDKFVTPPVEVVISVEKAIYVARACGCTVPPPGAKCGSYTIPAPGPNASPFAPSPVA